MLNKASGNMYGFATHTYNTVKGKCFHDCKYCYMKRFGDQKPVRFDEKELKTDLGGNNYIFVGSSCDMFAEDINSEWIQQTINHCMDYNNKYLFQTKNPGKFMDFVLPCDSIFCATVESNREHNISNAPKIIDRIEAMTIIPNNKMITIEPIMDFDLKEFAEILKMTEPIQVNIGADSGNHNLIEPDSGKVRELIYEIRKFTKVFLKDNLKRLLRDKK